MQRTSQRVRRRYENLWRTWPLLLWRECLSCKREFRREWGWRVLLGPYFNGRGHVAFLCCTCCPSLQDAEENVLSRHH